MQEMVKPYIDKNFTDAYVNTVKAFFPHLKNK